MKKILLIVILCLLAAPVLAAMTMNTTALESSRHTHEGEFVQVMAVADDGVSGAMTFSSTGIPAGASFVKLGNDETFPPYYDGQVGVFRWTPSSGQTGTHVINMTASNGTASATATVTIVVSKNYILDPLSCGFGYTVQGNGDCTPDVYSNYGLSKDSTSNPVGGGYGYLNNVTQATADYVVSTRAELLAVLAIPARNSTIWVLPNSSINMTGYTTRDIANNVTIASDRGVSGSLGAIIYRYDYNGGAPMFTVSGNGSRVTGLRIQGPDCQRHANIPEAYWSGIPTDSAFELDNDNFTFDNNELSCFPYAGIRSDTGKTNQIIKYNYIHENDLIGYGYGTLFRIGANGLTEGNIWDWNRHHIATERAGSGETPNTSYIVRFSLIGGNTQESALDAHGGNDDIPITGPDIDVAAGHNISVYNNTFTPPDEETDMSVGLIGIRGIPSEHVLARYNWVAYKADSTNTSDLKFVQYFTRLAPLTQYHNMTVNATNWFNETRPTGATPPASQQVNITYNRYLSRDAANSTWYDLRNGSGTSVGTPASQSYSGYINTGNSPVAQEYKQNIFYSGFANISSALPLGAVIDSGTLTIYGAGADQTALGAQCSVLVDMHPESTTYTALVAGDYDESTWTRLSDDCVTGAVANNTYTFTLNAAGIAYINTTGPTAIALMSNRSADLDGFTWAATTLASRTHHRPLEFANGSFAPSFTLVYHLVDITPPENNHDFTNVTTGYQSAISWVGSSATDFNHTYAFWNNTWIGNLTNTTTSYTKTGLPPSTLHTLSTKACDIYGNCNASWANYSVTTKAAPFSGVSSVAYNRILQRDASNSTWYSLRNGSGTAVSTPVTQSYSGFIDTGDSPVSGEYKRMIFYAGYINTSSVVASGSEIESGTLTVYGAGADTSALGSVCSVLVDLHPASTTYTAFAVSDYNTSTFTKLSDDCVVGSVANGSYVFNLNTAGIAAINKTGPTAFALMSNRSVNLEGYNWALTTSSSRTMHRGAEYAAYAYAPFFTLEYYDESPPENAKDFANSTMCEDATYLNANLSWTNTAVADFNHTYAFWNNTWVGNLTNTTSRYNASGLSELSTHTFSTKACDIHGLCNATWANYSVYVPEATCRPSSDFTANVTSGTQPMDVQFNDTSSILLPYYWNWSLGDGTWSNQTSATLANITKTYSTGGAYSVSLSITNLTGTNTTSKAGYITAYNRTTSNIISNVTSGTVPFAVQFNETSSNGTSYYWLFGDGNSSIIKNASFVYTVPGNYSVNHSVYNGFSYTNWTNMSYYINASSGVVPPKSWSNFTSDATTVTIGTEVAFYDASNNTPNYWEWNFGDGNTTGSLLQNPTHLYTATGLYPVSLNASNPYGFGGNITKADYISVISATSFVQQDLWMAGEYIITWHVTDSTTGVSIPNVTITDSNGHTTTTINGTGSITEPFGTAAVTFTATGYSAKTVTYVFDQSIEYDVQLTPSTTSTSVSIQGTPKDVKFHIQSFWGSPIQSATVSAQGISTTTGSWDWLAQLSGIDLDETPIANTSMSGATDTNGDVVFLMIDSVKYNVTVSATGYTFPVTFISPQAKQYTISANMNETWFASGNDTIKDVNVSVSWVKLNDTYSFVNISYNDQTLKTTGGDIEVYLEPIDRRANLTPITRLNITSYNCTNSTLVNTPTGGSSYKVVVNATTTDAPIVRTFTHYFKGSPVTLPGWTSETLLWLALFIIIFTAAFAGALHSPQMAVILCVESWVFWAIGWLDALITQYFYGETAIIGILTLATFITILWNVTEGKAKGKRSS